MLTETYSLVYEVRQGEFTASIGDFSAVGATRESALQNLAQRIAGAPQGQRLSLWNTKGKGGSVAETARGSKA